MEALKEKHFTFADYELDVSRRLLLKDGVALPLHAKAFDLLVAMIERHGEVLTKDQLLEIVWPGQFVEEGNLTVQVSTLRKLFGESKNEHRFIATVPGRGYSFVAEVVSSAGTEVVVERHQRTTVVIQDQSDGFDDPSTLALKGRERFPIRPAIVATAIVGIVLALGISYWFLQPQTRTQLGSIAVMPFTNESGNADLEYLADGLTETLINSLTQLENVSVRARATVSRFKGRDLTPQQARTELGVEAVLHGRVVQRGDQLTLFVSLIDTNTGDQIWGERYDRRQGEIVELQNEIARDVSNKLRSKLSSSEQEHIAKKYTANPEAYVLYLKGRYYWNKRSPADLKQAIVFFEQATQTDPNYALAYAGLADSYSLLSNFGGSLPHETKPKARTAALKALELDETLAEAHTALGGVLGDYDYDFAGEEREYKRALELNPNYALARFWYAEFLARMGRHKEAEVEYLKALEIDPLSLSINWSYAEALVYARRYDEGVAQLLKVRELEPDFVGVHIGFSLIHQMKANYAEAVESHARIEEQMLGKPKFAEQMRESFARGGWSEFLAEMTGPNRPPNIPYYLVATFNVAKGDHEAALENLHRSIENRETFILALKVDPRLDPIRDDPGFVGLLKRSGLPN